MMVWNNNKPRFDHLNSNSTLNPGDYVILNLSADAGNVLDAMTTNDVLIYKGAPTNKVHSITGISSNFYQTIGNEWNDWRSKQNYYSEKYHTYIEDHLETCQLIQQTLLNIVTNLEIHILRILICHCSLILI